MTYEHETIETNNIVVLSAKREWPRTSVLLSVDRRPAIPNSVQKLPQVLNQQNLVNPPSGNVAVPPSPFHQMGVACCPIWVYMAWCPATGDPGSLP